MTVIEKILKTQDIATLPGVATKILSLIENENTNLNIISKLVESDPALSLKVLRVSNSPLFAGRSEVTNMSQAIMNLGLNRLTNVILSVSIFSKFLVTRDNNILKYIDKFWWHSASVGVVTKTLVQNLGKSFHEKEFLAGMLHDLGKIALIQYDSNSYKTILESLEKEPSKLDVEFEKEIFGFTHLDVGYELAKKWRLPADFAEVICYHSNPNKASKKHKSLVAFVRVADLLCEMWGAGFYEGIHEVEIDVDESWKILLDIYPEFKDVDFEKITFETENEFKTSTDFLQILRA